MVHLIETIYEIFSSEGRKSLFYLKKWQKNCRFKDEYHLRTMKIVYGLG